MNSAYEIVIEIMTPEGFREVGLFSLGTDMDFALSTFDSLKGRADDSLDAAIRLCLVEKNDKTVIRQLKSIGCILNEFSENVKVIARDVFKLLNLEK